MNLLQGMPEVAGIGSTRATLRPGIEWPVGRTVGVQLEPTAGGPLGPAVEGTLGWPGLATKAFRKNERVAAVP